MLTDSATAFNAQAYDKVSACHMSNPPTPQVILTECDGEILSIP